MKRLTSHMKKIRLTLLFALMVFFIILMTFALVMLLTILMVHLGLVKVQYFQRAPLFMLAIASLIIGTILALIVSKRPLAPLRELMDAADRIADGDYTVRITPKGAEDFRELAEHFNNMAYELQSVELLRSDFINNFSHEFKTPIVSIRGFAKALKWENLTSAEREEYLNIIISESERLSELSANVLDLSKLEQQSILTNKTRFNLSEQIRLCIAMLAQKWSARDIAFIFDCPEIYITGNEELLRQTWINLLDNAIKFSKETGRVEVTIAEPPGFVTVCIADNGIGMSGDTLKHIFDKFYQAEPSRTTRGNGLGLSLTKKIIELHGGTITAVSTEGVGTTFTVRLAVR